MADQTQEVIPYDVARVAHFHCDHFEPYMPIGGPDGKQPLGVDRVEAFLYALQRTQPFKLSAFYASQSFVKYLDLTKFHPGGYRVESDEKILKLLAAYGADIQIHIHHESWPDNREALFQLVELLKEQRERVLGITRETPWSFIHGCWALNASDTSVCLIEDEIRTLMDGGCIADFTFPAGRRHCDPQWKYPGLVLPVSAPKGYDTLAADPRHVPSSGAGRFFIWSSGLSYDYGSLDVVATSGVSPNRVVDEWLSRSPVIDRTLYIKTHAHSLNSIPHPTLTPVVIECFSELQRRCDLATLPLHWLTASDVLHQLVLP